MQEREQLFHCNKMDEGLSKGAAISVSVQTCEDRGLNSPLEEDIIAHSLNKFFHNDLG